MLAEQNFSNASLTLSFAANESVKSEMRKQKTDNGAIYQIYTHTHTIFIYMNKEQRKTRLRTRECVGPGSHRDTNRQREREIERRE